MQVEFGNVTIPAYSYKELHKKYSFKYKYIKCVSLLKSCVFFCRTDIGWWRHYKYFSVAVMLVLEEVILHYSWAYSRLLV